MKSLAFAADAVELWGLNRLSDLRSSSAGGLAVYRRCDGGRRRPTSLRMARPNGHLFLRCSRA
jgi:hypothetical protein